jgi:hypothetical protein
MDTYAVIRAARDRTPADDPATNAYRCAVTTSNIQAMILHRGRYSLEKSLEDSE